MRRISSSLGIMPLFAFMEKAESLLNDEVHDTTKLESY